MTGSLFGSPFPWAVQASRASLARLALMALTDLQLELGDGSCVARTDHSRAVLLARGRETIVSRCPPWTEGRPVHRTRVFLPLTCHGSHNVYTKVYTRSSGARRSPPRLPSLSNGCANAQAPSPFKSRWPLPSPVARIQPLRVLVVRYDLYV